MQADERAAITTTAQSQYTTPLLDPHNPLLPSSAGRAGASSVSCSPPRRSGGVVNSRTADAVGAEECGSSSSSSNRPCWSYRASKDASESTVDPDLPTPLSHDADGRESQGLASADLARADSTPAEAQQGTPLARTGPTHSYSYHFDQYPSSIGSQAMQFGPARNESTAADAVPKRPTLHLRMPFTSEIGQGETTWDGAVEISPGNKGCDRRHGSRSSAPPGLGRTQIHEHSGAQTWEPQPPSTAAVWRHENPLLEVGSSSSSSSTPISPRDTSRLGGRLLSSSSEPSGTLPSQASDAGPARTARQPLPIAHQLRELALARSSSEGAQLKSATAGLTGLIGPTSANTTTEHSGSDAKQQRKGGPFGGRGQSLLLQPQDTSTSANPRVGFTLSSPLGRTSTTKGKGRQLDSDTSFAGDEAGANHVVERRSSTAETARAANPQGDSIAADTAHGPDRAITPVSHAGRHTHCHESSAGDDNDNDNDNDQYDSVHTAGRPLSASGLNLRLLSFEHPSQPSSPTSSSSSTPTTTTSSAGTKRPELSPYRIPSFSNSAPSLSLSFTTLGPNRREDAALSSPRDSIERLEVETPAVHPPTDISKESLLLLSSEQAFLDPDQGPAAELGSASRLPLTPLEEVDSPLMTFDSPADLAEVSQDPFKTLRTAGSAASLSSDSATLKTNETFYHALLELVRTEEGYTNDLADLVEVHFHLLRFAGFVTEEQRQTIVRDAQALLDVHRRLQGRLERVDGDLGWIRDHEDDGNGSDAEQTSPTASAAGVSSSSSSLRPGGSLPRRRFKSSDATVADAARRIASIFMHEAANLEAAYKPFCSTHAEAMDIVKSLSNGFRSEWDAFEQQCMEQLSQRKSPSTRLHLADFLIKPVQRVCKYHILLSKLQKNVPASAASNVVRKIQEALEKLKAVAAAVDEAQQQRALEIATVKIALRIDLQTAGTNGLLNHLTKVLLVGSAHVIHTDSTSGGAVQLPIKAAFYGIMLYDSHLVMMRIRKTNVYELKHWLPLRLFDAYKVPDGEGLLPYAIRMVYRNHTFEFASLCHQEQDVWASAIEGATYDCRRKWVEAISSNPVNPPIAADDAVICSEAIDSAGVLLDPSSPVFSAASDSAHSAVAEVPGVNVSMAVAANSVNASAAASPTEGGFPLSTHPSTLLPSTVMINGVRPRLSLKPPAQRVAVDLRLADLLSESVLTARAASKRSHAMPLHGPPPRTMSTSGPSLQRRATSRPNSFGPGGYFSYRSIIDSTLPSRRSSTMTVATADSAYSAARTSGSETEGASRPKLRVVLSAAATQHAAHQPTSAAPSPLGVPFEHTRPTKLQRSKTTIIQATGASLSAPSGEAAGQDSRRGGHQTSRSLSTLGKIRRRATSLYPEQGKGPSVDVLRQRAADADASPALQGGVVVIDPAAATAAEGSQTSVARNSSTSSSSSCASSGSTGHSNPSQQLAQIDTPQSSLPASPLLTPVDLESQTRWIKLGDAIAKSLVRKRSFASARPILAVQPEPVLEGLQLLQAQQAAEYIYSGRTHSSGSAGSSSASAVALLGSSRGNVHYDSYGHGYSNAAASTSSGSQGWTYGSATHERRSSWEPSSVWRRINSTPNVPSHEADGGNARRSVPNLALGADKRQTSSGSLWSIFRSDTTSHTCSPTPSIYESAHEDEDAENSGNSASTSAAGSPAQQASPMTATAALPSTSLKPYSAHPPTSPPAPAAAAASVPPSRSAPVSASSSSSGSSLLATPTPMKRKNSLSARLRAFRALGSSMTPLPPSSAK